MLWRELCTWHRPLYLPQTAPGPRRRRHRGNCGGLAPDQRRDAEFPPGMKREYVPSPLLQRQPFSRQKGD
jgi:hypothetical protein